MGFRSLFIVGFGQMGKSIANTLRINNFHGKIMASSRTKIENCDFIDGEFDCNDVRNDYNNSIFFLCTPPNDTPKIACKILEITKNFEDCIVSDVCSIKNRVADINGKNFISIHPMDSGNSNELRKYFFKKRILNYIITDNLTNINANLLERYNDFLHDFLNCENIKITAKKHDKTVALISHLQNLILASYYDDFSKIDNQMWREIFYQKQKNIKYFLSIFLEKIRKNIYNHSLAEAIVLTIEMLMTEEKIDIKPELFNPSLIMVLELTKGSKNKIKNDMNYEKFVKNMHNFYASLIGMKM